MLILHPRCDSLSFGFIWQLILFGEIVVENFGDGFLIHFVSKGFPTAHCPQDLAEQYCHKRRECFLLYIIFVVTIPFTMERYCETDRIYEIGDDKRVLSLTPSCLSSIHASNFFLMDHAFLTSFDSLLSSLRLTRFCLVFSY
ncbi:hypothetical protein HHK36_014405 [Tetracentron sinense]|uniref:Uncharacterized protein n=1 Tax=Tetracentron sinense TaxID=13715 RepID=A0A835DHP8_TETSI|nr:hypothetical protein HHK36_014405 [Tetracentron sinense]